jgi:predicted transcriptional regulator
MGKYRDRIGLVAAILEATGSGSRKTRIMFAANLSFSLLEKYLEDLLYLGFVKTKGSKYELTAKGRNFLKKYMSFKDRFSEVQDSLNILINERDRLQTLCIRPSARQYSQNSIKNIQI